MHPAYLAGLFDGEGCVGIYRNGNGAYHLRTQFTQNIHKKSMWLREYLMNTFGGNCLAGNTDIHRSYNWQLHGKNCIPFIEHILPHSVLKKDQLELALSWQKQHPGMVRDETGRILPYTGDKSFDYKTMMKLRSMKRVYSSKGLYKRVP